MPSEQQESYLSAKQAKRKRLRNASTDDVHEQHMQWLLATGLSEALRRSCISALGHHAETAASAKNKATFLNMQTALNLNAISGRDMCSSILYEMRDTLSSMGLKAPVTKKAKKT